MKIKIFYWVICPIALWLSSEWVTSSHVCVKSLNDHDSVEVPIVSDVVAEPIEDQEEEKKNISPYKADTENEKAIKRIAEDMGFEKWWIVAAICYVESYCGEVMVGDGGKSHGYYHIYSPNVCEENGYHKHCIMSDDRYDLEKSTRWTIARLQRHAHLGQFEMIRSHNGLPASGYNNHYVTRVDTAFRNYIKN